MTGGERVFHGGDIAWAEREFGPPPAPWLDLSTGINPFPYPVGTPPIEAWARLPDSAMEAGLLDAAAACYGAPGADHVVAAPGTQMVIQLLPRLRRPARVAVVGPTYGEHAPSWRAAGHHVAEIDAMTLDGGALDGDWDVVVLTNPNNPDGRLTAPDDIAALARRIGPGGGWVVVDEAFCDVAPEISVAAHVDAAGLVVLRSFGKFFGLAGLRLGFALAAPALAGKIRAALGPWAFSGVAGDIARRALGDAGWIEAMRTRLGDAADRLDGVLREAGIEAIGGTALFRLAADADAPEIFRHLATDGILVRHFPDQPTWLRFGLPGDDAARERLQRALES